LWPAAIPSNRTVHSTDVIVIEPPSTDDLQRHTVVGIGTDRPVTAG
jgi:hypothetical protein